MELRSLGKAGLLFSLVVPSTPAGFSSDGGCASIVPLRVALVSNFSRLVVETHNPYGRDFEKGAELALGNYRSELRRLGFDLQVRKFDYKSRNNLVARIAQQIVQGDSLVAVGYNYSNHAGIAAREHERARVPMITPSATADSVTADRRFVMSICVGDTALGEALARLALREGFTEAALATTRDRAYATSLSRAFRTAFAKSGGKVTDEFKYGARDNDVSDIAEEIERVSPDLLVIPNHEAPSAKLISELAQRGFEGLLLGADGWGNVGEGFFKFVSELPMPAFSVTHWHPSLPSPGTQWIGERFRETYDETRAPPDNVVLGFDAVGYLSHSVLSASRSARSALRIEICRGNLQRARARLNELLHSAPLYEGISGPIQLKGASRPQKPLQVLRPNPETKRMEYVETIEISNADDAN